MRKTHIKKVESRSRYEIPHFEDDKWRAFIEAGCYPYALDLKVNEYYFIGEFIGKLCTANSTDIELVETFKEEVETIFEYEVQEVETDYICQEEEKLVYLQRDEHTGYYHLLRQDSDRLWSHKFPKELPIRVDSIGNIIEDPDSMIESSYRGWCFLLRKRAS